MSVFERLLEVQARDTAVDRLRHQRARLPQRAELAALEKAAGELATRITATKEALAAVERRQADLEADAAMADRRIREIEARMYSGEVSATRDLLAMAAEIEAQKARRSTVEDEALTTMEEAEPLAAEIAELEGRSAALASEAGALRSAIAAAEADIDAQAAVEERSRAEAVGGVPTELLATYEKLRASLGGVGAARLVGTSCSGCHLTLPAQEVARLKREPPDALVLCDQCGRILVR